MLPYITYRLDSKTHKRIWFTKRNIRNAALKSLMSNKVDIKVDYLDVTQQKTFIVSNVVYNAIKMYYTHEQYAGMTIGEFVKLMTES